MNSFSPSGMSLFLKCREACRLRYIERIELAEENIHLAWGRTVHRISEGYWSGKGVLETHNMALAEYNLISPMELPSRLRNKWLGWGDSLAETVDLYFEYHAGGREVIKPIMLEKEFSTGNVNGRIDRLLLHPNGELELTELKTASEVISEESASRWGFTDNMRDKWRREYREMILRNLGLAVYDWYLGQPSELNRNTECSPHKISVEVILKPWRDRKVEIESFDVTREFISYRERTTQQVEWITREMAEYHLKYSNVHPWPMAPQDVCHGKFPCEYLPICNHGMTDKIAKLYQIRGAR